MKNSELKSLCAQIKTNAKNFTEAEIESTECTISSLWSKKWIRFFEHGAGQIYFLLTGVGILQSFIHYRNAVIPLIIFSLVLKKTDDRAHWIDVAHKGLQTLSEKDGESCQRVLVLSEAVPAARELRTELLSANRPLRLMHLWAMEKLDPQDLAGKLTAQREAAKQTAACKAVHGVPT